MSWRLCNPSKQASRMCVRSTFVVAITMAHAMTKQSRILEDFPGT
jgi:hypothetical protein